jgi:hypothetical protein
MAASAKRMYRLYIRRSAMKFRPKEKGRPAMSLNGLADVDGGAGGN